MSAIQDENFIIFAMEDGQFPERPETKIVYNYDQIIEKVKTFDNLWDYIQLFNQTGLIATCDRHYIDVEDNRYDYHISYSMFGTFLTDNNTDKIPDDTEGGVYLMGPAIPWDNADINAVDCREYTEEERYEHMARFYDSKDVIPKLRKNKKPIARRRG